VPKLFGVVALVIIATLTLSVNKTMSEPRCDMLKIAEEYISARYPSFDSKGLQRIISEKGNLWELTYEMPETSLGGVPIITIDKRTCQVVRAIHTQ
jgi:NTF2 fold immunity protein